MTEQTAQPQAPVVTITDLGNAYAIIDLAAKRGAFQATELSAVGDVANKLKTFIDFVAASQKAAAEEVAE